MAIPDIHIERLSVEERIRLAEALWNSLLPHPEGVPLTAAQEQELDRRRQAYEEDRDAGEDWRDVLARLGPDGR